MSRHILALNCGSSSVKSALFVGESLNRAQSIRVESIGTTGARLHVGEAQRALEGKPDLAAVVSLLLEAWGRQPTPVEAVVHRVVHGGANFIRPQLLDSAVLESLHDLNQLAPLHNPPALTAIRAAQAAYPDIPHIAVFDTAFHATLPRQAWEYALPAGVRAASGIRRYGFHGLSHSQVMSTVAEHLGRAPEELNIVSCHLGNGASVTAIEQGRSVETSMGMTPLEGLVMGTRAGDIDPGVLLHLLQARGMSIAEVDAMLNRDSGLKGLTGTNDVRDIERRATQGDEDCRQALQIYAHRVRKYIGAYAAVMGGVDAIAFTGGVGENSAGTRQRCSQRLEHLGAVLDEQRNRELRLSEQHPCVEISQAGSRTRLLVVRADEERTLARAAARLLNWPAAASASS